MNLIIDDTIKNKLILIYTEITVIIDSIALNIVITETTGNYNQIHASWYTLPDYQNQERNIIILNFELKNN